MSIPLVERVCSGEGEGGRNTRGFLKDCDREEREVVVVVEVWSLFRLWRVGLPKAEERGREWERCCSVACLHKGERGGPY